MTLSERLRSALALQPQLMGRAAALWDSPPRQLPDEWARQNRVYPRSSGVPGRREPGLTPYVIPFERFFDDDRYETCALITGTQMGKTDTMLDVIGWRVDTRPRPILYVGPSRDFVTEQFEPRLMKLFDEAARLAPLVARGKRNKKFKKFVNGVPIRLAWSGSATSLASDQAGDVFVDEYDKMVGGRKGVGDPFTLAKARADTYADRKIAVTSTPERGRVETEHCQRSGLVFWKVAPSAEIESPIWLKWQAGTRHHWAWQCPHCDCWFIPRLRDLKTPMKKPTPAEARRSAFLCCPVSGCVIEEADHKALMNERGRFVAPGQVIRQDGTVEGEPPDSTILSLWVSGLASPFVSWGERLEDLLLAQASGDPEQVQGALNKCAEVYAPVPLNAPTAEAVLQRRLPYLKGTVPREILKLVCGVDVQLHELYYTVRGFGSRGTSWLVDAERIRGRTDSDEPWDALADLLLQPIGGLRIELALIDSGFRPDKLEAGDVHRVYDFVRRYSWLCKATKGKAFQPSPLRLSKHEVKPNGKAAPFSVDLVTVDTDFFKSLVTTRIATEYGRPGSLGLPEDISLEYANHLVSEVREVVDGKPKWTPVSKQNHWLDCEALCAVAGYMLNVQRIPEGVQRDWDADAPALIALPTPKAPQEPENGPPAATKPGRVLRSPVAPEPPPQAALAQKNLRESIADRFAARSGMFRR